MFDGSQRIVFTSPESATGSLSSILFEAAEHGFLRILAIDEAHIVSEWGGDFRSSFQELAGLRRALLRAGSSDPFVTLLLTATLSQECVRTLETLFRGPGPFAVSSAVQLRPEPAFWIAKCPDEDTRVAWALEAIHHLPRPLILYTTRRADADAWHQRLLDAGYRRCARVTGDTPTADRQRVVEQWKAGDLNVVVATSAFGLGVDQADVRAVVHACVPESVDRFYQEVGRGGRDGKASISLVLYTQADLDVAQALSGATLIGIEKGLVRWRRMFRNNQRPRNMPGLYRVPVGITPGMTADRIDMRNARNLAWNVNTLTLMCRAGLLQLDAERPPAREAGDTQSLEETAMEHRERLAVYREHRVVRVLNPEHLEKDTWERFVEPVRADAHRSSSKDLALMREVLRATRCVGEILADAYAIHAPGSAPVSVARSCGGCPACRTVQREPFAGPLPEPPPPWEVSREMADPLAQLLRGSDATAIFYDEIEAFVFERFLRWMASMGIRCVVLPPDFPSNLCRVVIDVLGVPADRPVFFTESLHPRRSPRVPTLVLHPVNAVVPERYLPQPSGAGSNQSVSAIPRVLFLPADVGDPKAPHRRLRECSSVAGVSISLSSSFFTAYDMSVLKTAYATPSRVVAVYRFLLSQGRAGASRAVTEAVLSPQTLPSVENEAMVSGTITECVRMGLVLEEEGRLRLHPDLPAAARDRGRGVERLPLTIGDLVFRVNEENDDLGGLIAWYLAQEITTAPGDWDDVSAALGRQVGTEKLELTNDVRFGQFKYWACFLGFAWMHARKKSEWLVPDPTQHVRWRLSELFGADERLPPALAVKRLAEICPVFEGGRRRNEVEALIGKRPDRQLSSTTAHAWLRLEEEGVIVVEKRSANAEVYLMPDGKQKLRCSALLRPPVDRGAR